MSTVTLWFQGAGLEEDFGLKQKWAQEHKFEKNQDSKYRP